MEGVLWAFGESAWFGHVVFPETSLSDRVDPPELMQAGNDHLPDEAPKLAPVLLRPLRLWMRRIAGAVASGRISLRRPVAVRAGSAGVRAVMAGCIGARPRTPRLSLTGIEITSASRRSHIKFRKGSWRSTDTPVMCQPYGPAHHWRNRRWNPGN